MTQEKKNPSGGTRQVKTARAGERSASSGIWHASSMAEQSIKRVRDVAIIHLFAAVKRLYLQLDKRDGTLFVSGYPVAPRWMLSSSPCLWSELPCLHCLPCPADRISGLDLGAFWHLPAYTTQYLAGCGPAKDPSKLFERRGKELHRCPS